MNKIGLDKESTVPKMSSQPKPTQGRSQPVVLRTLPCNGQPPVKDQPMVNPIKYVQKQPRIKDTLQFTVQNLGI